MHAYMAYTTHIWHTERYIYETCMLHVLYAYNFYIILTCHIYDACMFRIHVIIYATYVSDTQNWYVEYMFHICCICETYMLRWHIYVRNFGERYQSQYKLFVYALQLTENYKVYILGDLHPVGGKTTKCSVSSFYGITERQKQLLMWTQPTDILIISYKT